MNLIELSDVLPEVFTAERHESRIAMSDVWLRAVSFARPGRYLISARSGNGKTSLCSFIHGDRSDYCGAIKFDGVDIRDIGIDRWCDLRRQNIAYMPQDMRLFPELTALENIMLKNRLTDACTESEIKVMAGDLGIDNLLGRRAGLLSAGQQQRVAAIRALCQPFDFILLDEPVSHLDMAVNRAMSQLVTAEAARRGAAIIATSVGNPLSIENYTELRL